MTCPRCGFQSPAEIAAKKRYEAKRLARLKAERARRKAKKREARAMRTILGVDAPHRALLGLDGS